MATDEQFRRDRRRLSEDGEEAPEWIFGVLFSLAREINTLRDHVNTLRAQHSLPPIPLRSRADFVAGMRARAANPKDEI